MTEDLSSLFYAQTSTTAPHIICSVKGMPHLYYTYSANTMQYTAWCLSLDFWDGKGEAPRSHVYLDSAEACREYLIEIAVRQKLEKSNEH